MDTYEDGTYTCVQSGTYNGKNQYFCSDTAYMGYIRWETTRGWTICDNETFGGCSSPWYWTGTSPDNTCLGDNDELDGSIVGNSWFGSGAQASEMLTLTCACPTYVPGGSVLTPAQAWTEIELAAASVAGRIIDFYVGMPGLGKNSVLAGKKADRFNDFFQKMSSLQERVYNFKSFYRKFTIRVFFLFNFSILLIKIIFSIVNSIPKSYSDADCSSLPAFAVGSNDNAAYVSPVDSADLCEELIGLFTSLSSYVDAFKCTSREGDLKPLRLVQRQRKLIVTKKLRQLKCGK